MSCGFCEAALSNSVGTLLVDCVVKPVGRQLNYVCCFHKNVKKLRERKVELENATNRLKHAIEDAEKTQLQKPEDDVQLEQSKAKTALSDADSLEEEIQQNKRCLNWCPDWSWRYRLSKKAMEKTLYMAELLQNIDKCRQHGPIGYRSTSTLPNVEFHCSEGFVVSKSSMDALDQLRVALQDDKMNTIGLYGMGGVGKTTLVTEVGKQAEREKWFDKVVVAAVSQKPNFEAIQDQIAQYIGFDMKNERGRRSQQDLWLRLKKEQRILIILDDVWTEINLKEDIGIPTGEDHKGCKILLTTRRQRVCAVMKCQEVRLDCLDSYEAWNLFAAKAGLHDSSDDAVKINLANQFLGKCQGLPIAIVTLGTALKGKSREEWKVAYKRFKNRRLDEIEDLDDEKNAYRCFETSFNFLKDGTRKCFLLCSLFPEDHEIYVENLVRFAWGLELYDNNSGPFDDVRTEVVAAIKILKDSCLLLDSGKRHVKMHDMVRDFALWIASSRKEMSFAIKSEVVETLRMDESFKDYKVIYLESKQTIELHEGLVFPNLEILSLGRSRAESSSEFFRGMEALKVFSLDHGSISLAAFQFQTKLRALLLFDCELSDISMLGKLKTLEILSLIDSDIIELPNEIGDLENLRVMELSSCRKLQGFHPGLLLKLSNLEELYLDGCKSLKWATKNMTQEEEGYASISELNLLPKLIVLSLDINSEEIPDGFEFRKLLIHFDICIGLQRGDKYVRRDHETCPISKSLRMNKFVDACKQLLEGVESLRLENEDGHQNVIPSLDFCKGGFRELTFLHLSDCESMKCLIDASKKEEIAEEHPHSSFQNLKKVNIQDCKNLKYLFPMCIANGLGQLQKLSITKCDQLEEIIQIVGPRSIQQGYTHHLSFQSLKEVVIRDCNKLKYMFPMCVANSLGQLQKLRIERCDELEEIIQVEGVAINTCTLQSLREVWVGNCNKLKSLNSLSQPHNKLENLTVLNIWNCLELEFIFPNLVPQGLPQLYHVWLENLPRLKGMNGNEIVLTSPSIHELKVGNCPQLTPFIISAKIQVLTLERKKTERKQIGNMAVPELREEGSSSLSSSSTECLTISNFEDYLFDSSYNLSNLKFLHLRELTELRVIWNGPIRVENFQNLSELSLFKCNKLRYTFSPIMAQNLPQLSKLSITDCEGLEEIIEKGQTSSQDHPQPLICFPNLTEIEISRCENLKCLFPITVAHAGLPNKSVVARTQIVGPRSIQQGYTHHLSFQSLKKVEISDCNKLKYMFPMCVANSLGQLQKLRIEQCDELEEIIQVEGVAINTCTLQSLWEVWVGNCNKLKSVFSLSQPHNKLENLTVLQIWNCLELEFIFPNLVPQGLPQLYNVCLSNLPRLKGMNGNEIVRNCPQLTPLIISAKIQIVGPRSIQQGYTHHLSFQSLKEVVIRDCNKLKYMFPMCVANSLGQLQKLRIERCDELEEIIQVEGVAINTCTLQSLREVHVWNCNKLKSVFSLSQPHNKLENLTELQIWNCLELEFIFPNLVPQGLPQLYRVWLWNLPRLKGMNGNEIVLTSPSIHWLVVKNCPQLTPFIISAKIQVLTLERKKTERKQIGNMAVPELREEGSSSLSSSSTECLTISNFEDYLFDSSYNLSNLKFLHLRELTELRVIWNGPIRVENFQNLSGLSLFKCNKLRYTFSPIMAQNLPQLSKLSITDCEGLEEIIEKGQTSSQDHPQPLICFPNLTEIYIRECENLKCLFPITIAHGGLPKLKWIYLKKMSKLEQVFEGDEANVGTDEENRIHLRQLEDISLLQLPNLTRLGPVGYQFVCPYLITLKVEGCANITTRFSVDSNKSVVARAQASQSSFDDNIVEELATAQETTWPIGSDIRWGSESGSFWT